MSIKLTYQPYVAFENGIVQSEGWIARCEGFVGWGRTRKSAYMRAYRHLKGG